MKKIILDSGPVITLALNNNLLWLLERATKDYDMHFYITEYVKKELIDNPINTKKFKFEALQVMHLIDKGIINLIEDKNIEKETESLIDLANSCFRTKKRDLTLVHFAEMSAIAAALMYKADAVMIDERTTRYLLEKPKKLNNVLSHKLHTKVDMNKKNLKRLIRIAKPVKFIRSAEFVTVAFEKGLLDCYLPSVKDPKKTLLEALLWGAKLNGCAIATRDLNILIREGLK